MTGLEHEALAAAGIPAYAIYTIATLMTVIGVLCGVIAKQYSDAKAVNSHRLAERDTLIAALAGVKESQLEAAAASRERNSLTAELAEIMAKANMQNDTLHALFKMQFDFLKEDYSRLATVVSSIAEGVRNVTALNTDMKVSVIALAPMLQSLQNTLEQLRRLK